MDEWFSGLVYEFADGFVRDAHVGAEFLYGEGLMVFFFECFFDFENEFAAGAFTSAGDELDVFRVDTDSGEAGFPSLLFCLLNKVWKMKAYGLSRISVVGTFCYSHSRRG